MRKLLLAIGASLICSAALAQQQAMRPAAQTNYGVSINNEQAKKVAIGAVAEAKKNNWNMSIAVVNTAGDLIYFERMDNTSNASVEISIHKARASARFRVPTSSFEDRLAAGPANSYLLTLDGVIAGRGGNLILLDGKLVGAIGVSGSTGQADNQVGLAGAAALID